MHACVYASKLISASRVSDTHTTHPIMWRNFSFNNDVIVHISLMVVYQSVARSHVRSRSFVRRIASVLPNAQHHLFVFAERLWFSLSARWNASHKRESKCVLPRFFSIQPNKYTREPYGDDLRWCLSTNKRRRQRWATRHLKTTTNDKWRSFENDFGCACLCVCV